MVEGNIIEDSGKIREVIRETIDKVLSWSQNRSRFDPRMSRLLFEMDQSAEYGSLWEPKLRVAGWVKACLLELTAIDEMTKTYGLDRRRYKKSKRDEVIVRLYKSNTEGLSFKYVENSIKGRRNWHVVDTKPRFRLGPFNI